VLPDAWVTSAEQRRGLAYLDAMVGAGCTAFDLAASYMIGGTERLFGHWLASTRGRDKLFLVGKGSHPYPVIKPNRLTAPALAADLDASLRRLGTDWFDLYLLHRDFPGAPLEPIVQTLGSALRAGRIRAWGVSNWTHDRIETIRHLAGAAGLPPMAASSPHFSVVDWVRAPWSGSVSIAGPTQRAARAFYARAQLPVLAWAALASGFLSADPPKARRTYESPANLARRSQVHAVASRHGATPSQVALAYLFQQPFPVSAVVAASSADKMRSNLEAESLRLSPDEVRSLEEGA
jgi:aryl-alcohol dehydrogenase-like predicted oxidoreductase